ncbi:MAG: glycoside hydrolase family 26 protein [Treponema sp.]|jgi:mannan endo-1,4-beta-mannosidase|nr:glycoside hydrolase family 26 protein [Treponema sp.]
MNFKRIGFSCRGFSRRLRIFTIGMTALALCSSCPSQPEEANPVSFGTDADATPNKRRLLSYLKDNYGKRIISGQMDTSWTTNASMDMTARVYDDTGKYPAIKGFDFIQLPFDGGREQIDEAIEWWDGKNNGETLVPGVHGIVTFCWHWKIGPKQQFYTKDTDFRIPYRNGKLDASSSDFTLIKNDLDTVAQRLQELEDQDIPVIWRPLHEASGGWFWWGASGPNAYKALWAYIYDYLVNTKGLDNLIWVWNGQSADWFPNAATVDVAGSDIYPNPAQNFSSQADKFGETLLMVSDRDRIVALTENGAIPDPDACMRDNAMWAWFMTWNDGYGSTPGQSHKNNFWTGEHHNTLAHKQKVYNHNLVITLDELPDISAYLLE